MNEAIVEYCHGPGLGLVRRDLILLISREGRARDVDVDMLRRGDSPGSILAVLMGDETVESMPSFALLFWDDANRRLVVRGTGVSAMVGRQAGVETISGGSFVTWNERDVSDCDHVELVVEGAASSGSVLPIEAGLVEAARLSWRMDQEDAREAFDESEEEPRSEPPDDAPHAESPGEGVPESADEVELHRQPAEPPDVSAEVERPVVAHGMESDADGPSVASPAPPELDYDFLFQPTEELQRLRARSAQAVPPIAASPEPENEPVAFDSVPIPPATAPVAVVPPQVQAAATPPTTRTGTAPVIIDEVPASRASASRDRSTKTPSPTERPAQPVVEVAGDDGLEEPTVHRAARTPTVAASDAPLVHAIHCEHGHLVPPHATECRECGGAVLDEDPVTVPRPVLGRLCFSTGEVVALDRSVVIGRMPKAEGVSEHQLPHLVAISVEDQEISRSHVAVRLDGWHVRAVDLHSTNGTIVERPGDTPKRLRAGEEAAIFPGCVVRLSDLVNFRFEVGEPVR